MGLSLDVSNKIFFVIGIIFELWFILMYSIDYGYIFYPTGTFVQQTGYGFFSINGFVLLLGVILLFFLGFTLMGTYVGGSAYSSALFSFMILVFTIQYYFIIRSFWMGVGLGNDNETKSLAKGAFHKIRIHTNDWRLSNSYQSEMGMTEAVVCSLSMLVAYQAVAGRISAFQVFVLCFFGVFFYAFNEIVIWRHSISDNGYTMRLFLFGSAFGIVNGFVLRFKDKLATTETTGYLATRHTRTYGLLGTCFVWLLLPILSCLNTIYDNTLANNPVPTVNNITTFLNPSILNLWFALSASCSISFCVSILLGRKIHPHDIVYSAFSGGIAYGATSTLNPAPFPAILCGLITGIIVTLLNHKLKKPLNNPDVVDTHGTLYTFFTAALIGGIYSAILAVVLPDPSEVPTSVNNWTLAANQWLPYNRTKFMQGGLQLAATFWSIGMGMLSSVATALIFYFTTDLSAQQVYADIVFTEACDAHEEKGPAPAHSATIQ